MVRKMWLRCGRLRGMAPVLACAAACGCATFRTGDLPAIEGWPPAPTSVAATKPTINLLFDGARGDTMGRLFTQSARAFSDSGLFSKVSANPERHDCDFSAKMTLTHTAHGASPVLAFFSGLTFFIIPMTAADEFGVETTIMSREGKPLGTFTKEETCRLWIEFFLFPLAPFKTVDAALDGACYDVMRATILDAAARKIF